jgi:hypothetical protein
MARALSKKTISIANGPAELHAFLDQYQAEYIEDSSTERGHVYWVPALGNWILVMKKGKKAVVTFHAADDCPCQML